MSQQPPKRSRLFVVPCTRAAASAYIEQHHRHHKPPTGAVFRLAVVDECGTVRGVATIGRPVARALSDGATCEVNRVATDGCPNACSTLLGAARRAAFALGYAKIITYTLAEEGGASLRGAGWTCDGEQRGNGLGWSSRGREERHPGARVRWSSLAPKAWTGPVEWPVSEQDTQQLSLVTA